MLRVVAGVLTMSALWGAGREPVLFDTDSGQFGDDGAALVMLLRSPAQVVVSGITVVPGNVWTPQGAEYMFHILNLLKQPELPVYAGAEAPLLHTPAMARESGQRWSKPLYSGAFEDPVEAVKPAAGAKLTGRRARRAAVEFLIREVERRPGEVTILALGPLTNVALALRLRPELETKIKRIVFMGGTIKAPGNATASAEFNFWFDPEAAAIVLRSRIPQKVMFGLDICNKAPLRKKEFDQIVAVQTPITNLFREDLGNRFPAFLKNPGATAYLWDALAAAYLLDPGFVVKSELQHLDVLTAWGRFYGSVVPLDRRIAPAATPVTVMQELNFDRVYSLYRDLLTRRD